jgi:hypothetical protein
VGIVLLGFSLLLPTTYAYNDDAMMLSIVSGGYTGLPDGHMVYVAYPLSGFLAILYRLVGGIPWFPLFMNFCYGGAAAGIWYRLLLQRATPLEISANGKSKTWCRLRSLRANLLNWIVTISLLLGGSLLFLLPGYIGLHYTLAAALLGGAGLVWLLTGTEFVSIKDFWRDQIGAFIYLLLCCMVRKQVFYLILPYLGLAVLWRIVQAKKEYRTELLKGCGLFVGTLSVGLLLIWGCNKIAYGGKEWKDYQAYNEARTELYDYSGILAYDANKQVYDELNISKARYDLIENYDLMLDQGIDTTMLGELASRYLEVKWGDQEVKQRLNRAIWEYRQCLLFRRDMPYSLAVFAGYACLVLLCIGYRRFVQLGLMAAAVLGRSLLWMFLFYQGRFPERVTVSLYLIELLLLAGILANFMQNLKKRKVFLFPLGIFLLFCMGVGICVTLPKVWTAAKENVEVQQEWVQLQDYFRRHPDTFYLLDVYATVHYTDQPFVLGSKTFENWMLLGGWNVSAPTATQKLEAVGAKNARQALLMEQTCLVMKTGRSKEWLDAYCQSFNPGLQAVQIDSVIYEGKELFSIYQIRVPDKVQ